MKKMLLFSALLAYAAGAAIAQPPSTTSITAKSFARPVSPVLDSNTAAVILSDVGSITITGKRDENWFASIFREKKRIQIFDKSAFDLASSEIYLFGEDKLDSLEATSYNLENGQVIATKLQPADQFTDKLSPQVKRIRFTLPNLHEGSILEISTRVTLDRVNYLPDWEFQHKNYPCLHSSFTFISPEMLRYAVVQKGIDSVRYSRSEGKWQTLQMESINFADDVYSYHWDATDIPAFRELDYLHAISDYADQLELYLTRLAGRSDQGWKQAKDFVGWPVLSARLLSSAYFGIPIMADRNENLKDLVEKLTATAATPMESAKLLYAYVRDNFKVTGKSDLYLYRSLYDINKAKKGDPNELNMLLIGLLRVKGLKANPVVMSTRDFGLHSVDYPLPEKLNYVVAKLEMYGESFYLDATDPFQAFGKIPLNCYNGHARVIAGQDTSTVFFYADSIREMRSTTVFIENSPKGLAGYFESMPGYYGSLVLKNAINKKGFDKYMKEYHGVSVSDYVFTNEGIDSVNLPEHPVKVHFDFTAREQNTNGDILYFSPVLSPAYTNNPFAASQRIYPVELDMPADEMYVLNMDVPAGYKIEEIPKSARVAFGGDGFFEYTIHADAEHIQLRTRIRLSRTFYGADEYNDLRDFFAFIIKKQSEQIVFKKIKT